MSSPPSGRPGIFYGWYIVAAGLVTMWINAGVGFYAFPVFFSELSENLGWGMGAINIGLSISMVLGGLVSPPVGLMVPKLGSKKVIIVGAILMSASFMLFGTMRLLWQYYLICALLAIGWTLTGTIPTSYSVSDWFVKKRGMAMGIMLVGVGLGGRTFAPLTRWLINHFEWQPSFFIYGVFMSVVLIPIAGAIFRERPAERGVLPNGQSADSDSDTVFSRWPSSSGIPHDWTFQSAVRTPVFWVICMIFILATFSQTALLLNQVRHFESVGFSSVKAATALGNCALLGIFGKLFFGAMADRYPVRFAMVLCLGFQAVGTVLLIYAPTLGSPYWFVLVWGFAMGGVITLQPLIVAECFGLKSFGVILGMTYVFTTIGSSVGAPFAGFIYDVKGSYILAFVIFAVAYAVATALSFLAVPLASRDEQSRSGDRLPL